MKLAAALGVLSASTLGWLSLGLAACGVTILVIAVYRVWWQGEHLADGDFALIAASAAMLAMLAFLWWLP